MSKSLLSIGCAILCAASTTAMAQKSTDTLRMAFHDQIRGVDYYLSPSSETSMAQAIVYDSMIAYDEKTHRFEPLLAKSWKRIDDKTLEFEIRTDVKWHDGQAFAVDDAVYTINWLADPNTKLRFKSFWSWISRAEKVGPNTMRVIAIEPTAFDESRMAYLTAILPRHGHEKLADKVAFGRAPIGTGMYRTVRVDENKGVVMERNKTYAHGGPARPVTNIGRLDFSFIPDAGTQLAQFLVGNLDVMRDIDIVQAEQISTMPGKAMTFGEGISWTYIAFDAQGRSGKKPLQDVRVRKAIAMSLNRDELRTLLFGAHKFKREPQSLCWDFQAGCAYSAPLPPYDPEGAKKLLAEAGYPNGFNLEITTFSGSYKRFAEVAANQMSKVGIKAVVDSLALSTYAKKQSDGKIETIVAGYPAGLMPDVSGTASFLFASGPRDYSGDAEMHRWADEVQATINPIKRKEVGRKLFDAATERAYAIPLTSSAVIFVHSTDVDVLPLGSYTGFGLNIWDVNWK
jgi:peptide/nickel transport system substrate-binding protein